MCNENRGGLVVFFSVCFMASLFMPATDIDDEGEDIESIILGTA